MSFLQYIIILTFTVLFYTVQGTKVRKCPTFQGKQEDGAVTISACEGPPCKLKKKDNVIVNIKFKPEKDVEKLVTHVSIKLLGIPFPFIGVDGTNACGKVFESDGKTKASCPLKKGKDYVYESSFQVREIYPNVKGVVHWALHDVEKREDVACFDLLARII